MSIFLKYAHIFFVNTIIYRHILHHFNTILNFVFRMLTFYGFIYLNFSKITLICNNLSTLNKL